MTQPVRLLHVIGTLNPQAGGPTEVVRVLIANAPAGYTSEVVTLDAADAPFLRDLSFPIHAMGPTASVYGRSPRLIPWLRANRSRFDGVVVHGLWSYCTYAVWRTMAGRVPYVVFPHGMLDPYFKRAFPSKHLKKWLYWLAIEHWALRAADRVLFTCDQEADLATQTFWLHRWKPCVVPFGTTPPPGDPIAQRETFLTLFPALRGNPFLLFLGRIHPKKGCDLLLDAFVQLAPNLPGLHLVMAGPDPQDWRAKLMQRAEAAALADRIHWPGMLTGDAKWGAFYAADAFILPSHQENFGIAVAEALACGRPVLLSDKVNIASEIADDGAGLMEPDTPAGTKRLLTRWFATPQAERERISARAIECFHHRYDMRDNAKTIARLFANGST